MLMQIILLDFPKECGKVNHMERRPGKSRTDTTKNHDLHRRGHHQYVVSLARESEGQ
jgi:hypothetical protein